MSERMILNMAACTLYPGKEKRVLDGHPWVFRSDIRHTDEDAVPGGVVRVCASNGRFLGQAFYNPQSQITLRLLTRSKAPVDRAFIQSRVFRAVEYRRRFADLKSCRLIYSESVGLPGLIVLHIKYSLRKKSTDQFKHIMLELCILKQNQNLMQTDYTSSQILSWSAHRARDKH